MFFAAWALETNSEDFSAPRSTDISTPMKWKHRDHMSPVLLADIY